MKRTVKERAARDRTYGQPKPVERVELNEKHPRARMIALIVAIVVALVAFGYVVVSQATVLDGWREIEANVTASEMNCSQDFVFTYYLGSSGISAAAESKALTILYTDAAKKAYRIFNRYEEFEDTNNLYTLNHQANTPIQVDEALYQAFELIERMGSRYAYLAPAYEEYHNLFFCNDDWETESFDPYQNEEVREYFAQIAEFARNPEDVNVELLGDNTVLLKVSDRYAAFAEEYGIESFVDFYWMTNAFIIDYLAETLEESGYNKGALSSYDGFVRCLSNSDLEYSYQVYDVLESGAVLSAATISYSGGTTLVNLHNLPLNTKKEIYYYRFEDGEVRSAYADTTDGLSKAAVPIMIATSGDMGCAEAVLRLTPVYATDSLDEEAVLRLTEEGLHPLYCRNQGIVSMGGDITFQSVTEGYMVADEPF